jgi:YVTN family beta-propeller protein
VVNVINVASNTVVNTILINSFQNGNLAISPSGGIAAVPASVGTIIINTTTNTIANIIATGSSSYVAFNPKGGTAYVTAGGTVKVINISTNTVLDSIGGFSGAEGVAFNPQGTLAYVANGGSSTVRVINVSTNTIVNTITVGTNPYGIALNPAGTFAYVTNKGSNTVSVINTATNSVVNTIGTVGTGPVGIALNPSGTLAYVTDQGGNNIVEIVSLPTYMVINTIKGPGASYTFPNLDAFNPQGTLVYVPYSDGGTTISVFAPSETAVQPLSTIQTNNGLLQLTVNAISSNTISFTFNGVAYTESPQNGNLIYGVYNLYGFAEDGTTGLAGVTGLSGTNAITVSNTVTINSAPIATALTPSNSVLINGQTTTYNVLISGGTGPFTVNLVQSNGAVVNTIIGAQQGLVTFGPITPTAGGQDTYNAVATDMGTTTPYPFNSSSNTITGAPYGGSPLKFNYLYISNQIIDGGQTQYLTAYIYNGVGPYTYNFMVYNSAGLVTSTVATSASPSNTFGFAQSPSYGTGSIHNQHNRKRLEQPGHDCKQLSLLYLYC